MEASFAKVSEIILKKNVDRIIPYREGSYLAAAY